MSRTFVFASAENPDAAAAAVANVSSQPDLCIISPSSAARRTATLAVGGRWVETIEEPLLAAGRNGEDGDDALARLAQALRAVVAYDGRSPLVVFERFDILGATAFALDETGLERIADDLERALPAP